MTAKQLFPSFGLVLLVSTLFGCGGGGGGGGLVSGIGGTGITASGTITGFGSIFVNGVEFETNTATVTLDGNPGSESELRLGMVVTVRGTVDDSGTRGSASEVDFNDDVQGPVSGILPDPDGLSKTFTVLNVSVQVDRTRTVFDGVTFETLAVNDSVEVSGFFDAASTLQATRIEKKADFQPGVSEVELKGTVSGLSGTSFTLGGFTVEFAGADLSEVPGGVVTDGLPVEVKGTLSGTTITASRIAQEDELFGDNEDKVSLEGIVSNFVSNSSLTVAGQLVDASAASFEPAGLTLADGIEVEVEGPIVAGVLQAVKVEARGGDIELEARVSAVNAPLGTLTLQFAPGTLNVVVDSRTALRDDTGVDDPLTLNEIVATDFLQIEAYRDGGTGTLIATEIRRDTPDDDLLQGPVDECLADTRVTVLGLTYTLSAGTNYQDQNDALITGTAFCSSANAGGFLVKIRDDLPTPDGIADEVDLED